MPALIVAEQEEAPAQGFVLGSTIALAFVLPFSGIFIQLFFYYIIPKKKISFYILHYNKLYAYKIRGFLPNL